jgi:hypothetical protein
LEKAKELWVRLDLVDPNFPAQDLTCLGCKPEIKCAYSELRACAGEKGIDNCGFCVSYPCKLVNAAFEKTERLRSRAASVCTSEEMDALDKAFFSKRKNLGQTHGREIGGSQLLYCLRRTPFGPVAVVWSADAGEPRIRRVLLSKPRLSAERLVQTSFPDARRSSCAEIDLVCDRILTFLTGEDIHFSLDIV